MHISLSPHLIPWYYFSCTCTVPGVVQNLVCAQSSSPSSLFFSWDLPSLLGSEVVSYQVIVSRLEHRPGTRDVTPFVAYDHLVEMKEVSVNGLGEYFIVLAQQKLESPPL